MVKKLSNPAASVAPSGDNRDHGPLPQNKIFFATKKLGNKLHIFIVIM